MTLTLIKTPPPVGVTLCPAKKVGKQVSGFQKLDHTFFKGPAARLGGNGFLIYMALRGRGPKCYPSLTAIQADTGLPRMTLLDNLKRLEEMGVIKVNREPGKRNNYEVQDPANWYEIRTGTKSDTSTKIRTPPVRNPYPTSTKNDTGTSTESVPRTRISKQDSLTRIKNKIPVVNEKAVDSPVPTTAQLVWIAYAKAYSDRYSTPPIRNAKVNSQIVQFTHRVPEEEAPSIAAFYVWHNQQFYVSSGHPIGLLLKDAEKVRTEWITGKRGTVKAAREKDRLQERGEVWQGLIEEAEREERLNQIDCCDGGTVRNGP